MSAELIEMRKTNALLETIGAILIHQCEITEKDSLMRRGVKLNEVPEPLYSILELRKSLIAASK